MKTALVCIGIIAVLTSGASAIWVTESGGMIEVDTGQIQFALDTGRSATLRWVEKDGRRLVKDNEAPLLSARLMESAVYDGVTDFAPGRRFIDAQYTVDRVEHAADDHRFAATVEGKLQFEGGDRLPFTIRLAARSGATHLDVDVTLSTEGDFRERFVRDVVLRLPLALDWRKRVAQGGDQGLQWDTRYYYEFPGRMGILPHPDRNEFRYFAVEQDSAQHFRIWRAESDTTPELTHQHGIKAAGWTSVYDASGGVLFALRNMAEAAPKTLAVDAAGGQSGPVTLPADGKVALCQQSPMHYRLIRADEGHPRVVETQRRAQGWMDVRDGKRGVTLALRDMWQTFPKALEYSPESGNLTAWLRPAAERLMDVRRYSDYPHLAQGESVGADNRWVKTHYYGGEGAPNDPFAGTSRTHELLLEFHAGNPDFDTIAAVNADFQSPPLIYSGLARYRDTGITLPLPDFDNFPNIAKNLDRFTDFWLFHQRYWNWYGI